MSIFKPGRPKKYDPFDKKGKEPPSSPGLYRIRDSANEIVYVGETNNLKRRMGQHISQTKKLKNGEKFEYKEADGRSSSVTRRVVEQEKIEKFKPERNSSLGGEGRIAKKRKGNKK